jgi:hypothetical protein
MAPSLGKYVNKTILVSIPPISGDVRCRPYKLTGVELIGLWLEGADLARDFLALEHKSDTPTTWTFFIPYSQIACVAIGTTPVVIPATGAAPAAQSQVSAPGAPATVEVKPSPTSSTASQKRPKNK